MCIIKTNPHRTSATFSTPRLIALLQLVGEFRLGFARRFVPARYFCVAAAARVFRKLSGGPR